MVKDDPHEKGKEFLCKKTANSQFLIALMNMLDILFKDMCRFHETNQIFALS